MFRCSWIPKPTIEVSCRASVNRPYSANVRANTGGKFQLLAWAFRTAATVINLLYVFSQVTTISEYSALLFVGDGRLATRERAHSQDTSFDVFEGAQGQPWDSKNVLQSRR